MSKNAFASFRHWGKRALKGVAFLFGAVLALTLLAAALVSWTGRRDWARVQAELAARGEALFLADLIPPSVPEARNFYADPLWEELADLVDAEENGFPVKRPRLPNGQRQIDALKRPLTAQERETLRVAFPEFAVPEDATLMGLVHSTFKAVREKPASDPRRTAEFLLAVTDLAAPTLARLHILADRPDAWFPLDASTILDATMELSNAQMTLVQLLRARMWAEGMLGKGEAVSRDFFTAQKIPDSLAKEPLLISLLIRLSTGQLVLEGLEAGLQAGGWTDGSLAAVERRLADANYPAGAAMALRGERGFGNALLEDLRKKPDGEMGMLRKYWSGPGPSAWLAIFGPGDQAVRNVLLQKGIDFFEGASTAGLNARTVSAFETDRKALTESWVNRIRYPVAAMGMPSFENIAKRTATLQDQTAQTRVVCALQRHHLAHGAYPETLAALVPAFLPAVPVDVSTLRPLLYRRDGGGFRLWTPGWNERDEDGQGDDVLWGAHAPPRAVSGDPPETRYE
ncbi:MAG: hypothetical protein IAE94_16455 [Chthoniobacterales bacterium]|nr:hypothetical protein [Chthoniobacterales bacterium]